jgi:hypothetical protein
VSFHQCHGTSFQFTHNTWKKSPCRCIGWSLLLLFSSLTIRISPSFRWRTLFVLGRIPSFIVHHLSALLPIIMPRSHHITPIQPKEIISSGSWFLKYDRSGMAGNQSVSISNQLFCSCHIGEIVLWVFVYFVCMDTLLLTYHHSCSTVEVLLYCIIAFGLLIVIQFLWMDLYMGRICDFYNHIIYKNIFFHLSL